MERITGLGARACAVILLAILMSWGEILEARPVQQAGRTWYVATHGSDGNPGSLTAPFRHIHHAARQMQSGDTMSILPGTYADHLWSTRGFDLVYDPDYRTHGLPSGTGTGSSPYTIVQAVNSAGIPTPGTVTMQPDSTGGGVSLGGMSYIVVDGLIVDGMQTQWPLGIGEDGGVASHHITIQNCEVRNAVRNGISGHGTNIEFINNKIHHNGWEPAGPGSPRGQGAYGAYFAGNYNLWLGNEVYRNMGYGFHLWDSREGHPDRGVNNNIVAYNYLHNNSIGILGPVDHGLYGGQGGMIIGPGNDNVIYNNVFWNNPGTGSGARAFAIGYGAGKAYNNTCYDTAPQNGYIEASGSDIRNNIAPLDSNSLSGGTISANLWTNQTNPQFVNPTANPPDPHLQSGSPAIDQGVDVSSILAGLWHPLTSADFDGNARSGAWDIGAYEFTKGGGPPPGVGGGPPPGEGGGPPPGGPPIVYDRDNPNGDAWINDRCAGGSIGAGGSARNLWPVALLALACLFRRRSSPRQAGSR